MPQLKLKNAKQTVEKFFFVAINTPDYKDGIKYFSKLTKERIGEEKLLKYIYKLREKYGLSLKRKPIYEESKTVKIGGQESTRTFLKYETRFEKGVGIETVLLANFLPKLHFLSRPVSVHYILCNKLKKYKPYRFTTLKLKLFYIL